MPDSIQYMVDYSWLQTLNVVLFRKTEYKGKAKYEAWSSMARIWSYSSEAIKAFNGKNKNAEPISEEEALYVLRCR